MRIKLDENLPATLGTILSDLGHDVDTVPEEDLRGAADQDVWSAAQRESRLLVTQDLDFSDIRSFAPGTHHGLLLVRLSVPGRRTLEDHVARLFRSEAVESWAACFVISTDAKIRVRRRK